MEAIILLVLLALLTASIFFAAFVQLMEIIHDSKGTKKSRRSSE